MIYLANDKYRATLRANWLHDPADGSLLVSSVPDNVPTLVVVGWQTDFETVFAVEGKSGSGFTTYALTGVTRLRGYDGDIPENTSVNCLNNMEFLNQYLTYLGIQWKGEWSVSTAYKAGEGISYEGSSYIALVDTTGNTPPEAGKWQIVTARGATWTQGAGAPDNANGMDGDFYLRTSNYDVYFKATGTWSVTMNLKGIQGIQGIAATLSVGTVTTGAPGSSVIITNVGDENDAILDITIPEGDKGEIGNTGASIISGAFVSDDLVFTKDDANTVVIADAKIDLKGDKGDTGVATVSPTSLTNETLINDTTHTDDYSGSLATSPGSYFVGLKINLKVTNANTGAASLNVNSLGVKAIKKNVTEDMAAGDIKAGQVLPLVYDGTNFQLVGGGGSSAGGADVLTVQVFS